MKALEIIITILVCFFFIYFVLNQNKNIKQEKSRNEKIIEEIKQKYKQEEIRL